MANPIKYLSRLRPIDIVCIGYCLLMILVISIFGYRLSDRLYIVEVYSACLLAAIAFILLRKIDHPIFNFFTSLYPLILLTPFYGVAGHQVHLIFDGFFDVRILALENAIFPVHPTVWLERFNRPLITEWMMLGYSGYVLLLPITVGYFYLINKHKESQHLLLSLMISFFICYIIFTLFPVLGPRFVLADKYQAPLHGYIFKAITGILERNVMLHGGAFPSAHCAAATVMLLLSFKYDRRLFYIISPLIITLYISTIYGRYHYPLDVLAGILTGIIGIKLARPLSNLWEKIVESLNQTKPGPQAKTMAKPDRQADKRPQVIKRKASLSD